MTNSKDERSLAHELLKVTVCVSAWAPAANAMATTKAASLIENIVRKWRGKQTTWNAVFLQTFHRDFIPFVKAENQELGRMFAVQFAQRTIAAHLLFPRGGISSCNHLTLRTWTILGALKSPGFCFIVHSGLLPHIHWNFYRTSIERTTPHCATYWGTLAAVPSMACSCLRIDLCRS